MEALFEFERIDINDIDQDDCRFKLTKGLDDQRLERSIRSFGVLNPPLLLRKKQGFSVISGFKRIDIVSRMGIRQMDARVITTENELHCAQIAVMENACQRQLLVSEQIRAVSLLAPFFSDPHFDDIFFQTVCEALMLPGNKGYIKKLMHAAGLSGLLLDLVEKENISLEVAVDLASFDSETQDRFHPFFSEFKMSLSKQKEFILMVREIAARETGSVVDVLDDVGRIYKDYGHITDKNAIFAAIRNYLHGRRYPEMSKTMGHHTSLVAKLRLPDGMKFYAPEALEGSNYQIQIMFKTLDELNGLIKKIEEVSIQPEMGMILTREYMMK